MLHIRLVKSGNYLRQMLGIFILLELVREVLKHSSISMTERYYVNPSSERIKCMADYLDFEKLKGV